MSQRTANPVTMVLLLAGTCFAMAAAPPADTVLLGGKVITLDDKHSIQQALAIRDGKIVAVGADKDVSKYVGRKTTVIRLQGKTVIPGIIQSHSHAIGVARQALRQPHAELTSIAEIQAWVRDMVKKVPAGQWIQVPRADITRIKERRHPTPAELDAAAAKHPVAFKAARKWALNSLGYKEAGIAEAARKDANLRIVKDAQGKPRVLIGADAQMRRVLPSNRPGPGDARVQLDSLKKVLKIYNSVGITSIFERASNREGYDTYQSLRKRGDLSVRVTMTFRGSMRSAEDVNRFVARLDLKPGQGDDWLKPGPLKITVDGGIHWGNTRLREPYGARRVQFYVLDDPQYRGDLFYTVKQMQEAFVTGHKLGWQMCCHVTGDAGVDRVLDALDVANRVTPLKSRRFTLVHAYFPTKEAIKRGKQLGICVDTQADLYFKDSEAIAEVYGKDWAERFIGIGDWRRGGIPVAVNGDHMMGLDPDTAMNSFNPFLHLYVAVTRKNNQGKVYGPRQKLSRMDALRSMTTTAAYLSFDEKKLGSLQPGRYADLAVLDRDYLVCPEEEIRQIKVVRTMVAGKTVYSR